MHQSLWEYIPSSCDPPHDGNNLSFDGGDEKTDGSDDNTIVHVPSCDSGLPESPQSIHEHPAIRQWLWDVKNYILDSYPIEGPIPPGIPQLLEVSTTTHTTVADISDENLAMSYNFEKYLFKIEERVIALRTDQHRLFDDVNSKMDNLLQKMDAAWTENNRSTPHGNGNPPPVFATTSTETIDFSIGFGCAALSYVSL
jgi:hypothetical protein